MGDPCDNNWNGITCENGLITKLNFQFAGLSGALPSSIGDLSDLKSIYFLEEHLGGTIPEEITQLSQLEYLTFYFTPNLSGNIPTTIGQLTNLKYLDLTETGISGGIPASIGNLSNLTSLYIGHNNNLTGSIPSEIANLSSLESLEFFANENLSGTIPPEIGSMSQLKTLYIGNNNISGSIPIELTQLSGLDDFTVCEFGLSGPLISFTHMVNLRTFRVCGNGITGQLPTDMDALVNLEILSIKHTQVTGNIPPSIANMNVYGLELNNNQLYGTILSSLINETDYFSHLNLSNNNLTGSLPEQWSRTEFPLIAFLDLSHNQLSGDVHIDSSDFEPGSDINLSHNQFNGSITTSAHPFRNISSYLDLSHNQLSGPLPMELLASESIGSLDLSHNQYTGTFHSDIENISLYRLNLSSNQLSGLIPSEFTQAEIYHINLDYNALYSDDDTVHGFINNRCWFGISCDWQRYQSAAPLNLTASSASNNSITLSWDEVPFNRETGGYSILMATDPQGPFTTVYTTPSKQQLSHTIGNLSPDQEHHFQIQTYTLPFDNGYDFNSNFNFVVSEPSTTISAQTLISSNPIDLAVALSVDPDMSQYTLRVRNSGSADDTHAQLTHMLPPTLFNLDWHCQAAINGAQCPQMSGTGDLLFNLHLPSGGSMDFIFALPAIASVENLVATIAPSSGISDTDLANNVAHAALIDLIYRSDFE